MSECQKCQNWHDCKAPPDFFHYGEIRWCPYQCLWIISHKETLKGGGWPQDPSQSDNNFSRSNVQTEAPFVKPELIIGEVEARLAMTPSKGELLITQVEDGRTIDNLSDGARAVLMYIKGWRRKGMSFYKWQWQIRQRKNEDKLSSKMVKIETT